MENWEKKKRKEKKNILPENKGKKKPNNGKSFTIIIRNKIKREKLFLFGPSFFTSSPNIKQVLLDITPYFTRRN